jgi:hypothetical protein
MRKAGRLLVLRIARLFANADVSVHGPAAPRFGAVANAGRHGPGSPADAPGDNAVECQQFDPGIVHVLADKVLLAWLRNRYQLLFPFLLDLSRLDERQSAVATQAMIAAAQADGTFDLKERERIGEIARRMGAGAAVALEDAIADQQPLAAVLAQVSDVQTAALIYAVSLMAVNQRSSVNRLYLKYLATRLRLSEELVGSLEQRFHSSG